MANDIDDRLWRAAEIGDNEEIKTLLAQGANLECIYGAGLTSLLRAAASDHPTTVQLLVERGADIHKKDRGGCTCGHWASYHGHLELLKYLAGKGLCMDETDDRGDNCLHKACEGGHLAVMAWLMEQGLSLDTPNKEGETPRDVLNEELKYDAERTERRKECLAALKTGNEDTADTEYQKWLDKATDEGTVDTQWSNVSVAGASGTGKTSVMNLLLLNDPVTVHNSTPILENYDVCVAEEEVTKEEADSSVSASDTSGSESLPESDPGCQPDSTHPTIEERKMSHHMFFADGSKDHTWKVAEKDTLHKKLAEAIVTLINSEEDEAESEPKPKPQHCNFPPCYPSAEPFAVPPGTFEFKSTIISTPAETPSSNTSSSIGRATREQILEMLPHLVRQEADLCRVHFINMLDSGGQASFMDIAPALFRYNSVNLIVHKLNERLNATANFFYCINGMRIGEEKRIISNKQLLKALFSSRMGIKKPDLEGLSGVKIVGEAHVLVIGTHYDIYCEMKKEGKLEETLVQKNELLSSELSEFNDWIVEYQSLKGHGKKKGKRNSRESSSVEFIFPINALSREKRELKIAGEIRRLASRCYIKAKVPVRWYLIQIEINELKASGEDMVIIKKVLKIGFIFRMSEEEVRASLKYFHDLTVCLYFHEVLPNVVFLTPKRLFKKLSEIVAVSLKEHTHLVKKIISERLCKEGVFTKALLDFFPDDYKEGLFTPDDFLVLMEHLLIITRLPDGKSYFMPSVLECLPDPLKGLGEAYFTVAPLCFTWNDAVPNGLFPSLLQYLQGRHEPDFVADINATNYRNKVSLKFLEGIKNVAKVVLFELPGFIGVAHSGDLKDCPPIHTAICKGIAYVVKTFSWKEELAEPQESFLCTMEHAKQLPPHMCRINKRRKTISCSVDDDKQASLNSVCYQAWKDVDCAKVDDTEEQSKKSQLNEKSPVPKSSTVRSNETNESDALPIQPQSDDEHSQSSKKILQERPRSYHVFDLTVSHSARWNDLGRRLGIAYNYREQLKKKASSDEDKLEDVLEKWMETESVPVTWSSLIEALEAIKLMNLVRAVKKFLKTPKAIQSYSKSKPC